MPTLKWSSSWDSVIPFQEDQRWLEKRANPEEIALKLRQVEVLQSQGKSIADAVRQIGVTPLTDDRWRKEYGGMNRDQLKRLKDLSSERRRFAHRRLHVLLRCEGWQMNWKRCVN